jgi:hypothetical protein
MSTEPQPIGDILNQSFPELKEQPENVADLLINEIGEKETMRRIDERSKAISEAMATLNVGDAPYGSDIELTAWANTLLGNAAAVIYTLTAERTITEEDEPKVSHLANVLRMGATREAITLIHGVPKEEPKVYAPEKKLFVPGK